MKLKHTLVISGCIGLLAAGPAVFAADDSGGKPDTATPEVVICEPLPDGEIIVSGDVDADAGTVDDSGEAGVVDGTAPEEGETGVIEEGEGGEVEITVEPDGNLEDGGGVVAGEPGVDGGTDAGEPVDSGTGAVPVDWVKRGGGEVENPDVIFMTTAMDGGPGPEQPVMKGAAREFGQDDRGVAIEAKGAAGTPEIQKEKKGPVALIKKDRVFLR